MNDSALPILWLRSWERSGANWHLRAACLRNGSLVDVVVPAQTLNQAGVFDMDSAAKLGLESLSLGVDIDDVHSLSPLVDPTDVLKSLHPRLRESGHAIYVGYLGDTPIYLPAALLIRTLWLWSDWVLPALMTPNSLALYLGRTAAGRNGHLLHAIGGLSSWQFTDTHLRRLAWLGTDTDARNSWGSVLSSAYQGKLALRLPHARLSAWVWGVRVGTGVLACELLTPNLDFWLPEKNFLVKMGRTERPCPPAPPFMRRADFAAASGLGNTDGDGNE